MKHTIVAQNKDHLKKLIQNEINFNGDECDLNHIDVSAITDMSDMFANSSFNGNISQWNVGNVKKMSSMFGNSHFNGDISGWDVSNVTNMSNMFISSIFNGDISEWNVSKVNNMGFMFAFSAFNGDISKWDVSKVEDMFNMFDSSNFSGDISEWKPYKLQAFDDILNFTDAEIPYWAKIRDNEARRQMIDAYHLTKELQETLGSTNDNSKKKLKI